MDGVEQPPIRAAHPPPPRYATSIQITALDGIVNVNSLFTFAAFVGLAWSPSNGGVLVDSPTCAAGPHLAESMVTFHVFSFSSFLFSSLVAMSLKQAIRLAWVGNGGGGSSGSGAAAALRAHVNKAALRAGIVISAIGTVSGYAFLMLALVDLVQIKLGTLSCGSLHTYGAVVPLLIFVPTALLFYVSVVFYAFTR
ncbi:hypothetical protein QJS10_CPB14g00744 [Acorus calamus]|uniref:Maternal effect embryo arrest 60 n=1 Tax=Acorus calamus TaxID=4465 RepID=A0AAV9D9V3_ACOCL|nr:hypothetical protein QJS10_CPB14g00744 [Acorus calamus]